MDLLSAMLGQSEADLARIVREARASCVRSDSDACGSAKLHSGGIDQSGSRGRASGITLTLSLTQDFQVWLEYWPPPLAWRLEAEAIQSFRRGLMERERECLGSMGVRASCSHMGQTVHRTDPPVGRNGESPMPATRKPLCGNTSKSDLLVSAQPLVFDPSVLQTLVFRVLAKAELSSL
jgi:hypothetical protein